VKTKNPQLLWQSRVFEKSLVIYLKFLPALPIGLDWRCQMAIQPFTEAIVACLENVVFISYCY
jgi:hypothetical protein